MTDSQTPGDGAIEKLVAVYIDAEARRSVPFPADMAQRVPVSYTGMLPDLFKEGKGVVAQGKLGNDGVFRAEQVLAKHDENYMPPEAAEALEKARHGQMPPSLQNAPKPGYKP